MKNGFAHKIKKLRKDKKINQAGMAELLGVHLQTISRYERGELSPSVSVLSVLAEKFGVDIKWLMSNGDEYQVAAGNKAITVSEPTHNMHGSLIDRVVDVLRVLDTNAVQAVLDFAEERKLLAELKKRKVG